MMDEVFFTALILCCMGHPWIALLLCIMTGRIGFIFREKKG